MGSHPYIGAPRAKSRTNALPAPRVSGQALFCGHCHLVALSLTEGSRNNEGTPSPPLQPKTKELSGLHKNIEARRDQAWVFLPG